MPALVLAAMLVVAPSSAQVLLNGTWSSPRHEDLQERGPGSDLGDYGGLPINAAARQFADSWDASRLTLQEHQCGVHVSPYIYRGPMGLRIWEERNPETQEIVAYKHYINTYEQDRTIWMDGRPHPSEKAPHTFMGFSTGAWEGNILTVRTTHIKHGWIRKNGLPESDEATMTEHFIRHGNVLTRMSIIYDPVYLTEPLVKTDDFVLDTEAHTNWLWPCEYVEEIVGRPKGKVPHFLPGTNPHLTEFADFWDLPYEAMRGGAASMYPEYEEKIKAMIRGNE